MSVVLGIGSSHDASAAVCVDEPIVGLAVGPFWLLA